MLSNEALHAEILQLLNQGQQVSKDTFPDVSHFRIRNTMILIQQELASAAFIFDPAEITLVYRNAEGVRQIYEVCQGPMNLSRAKVLVQRFIKELGLPEPSFYSSFPVIPSTNNLDRRFLSAVLELALDEARRMRKDYLGTPHLFLALTRLDGGSTQEALRYLHFSPDKIREVFYLSMGTGNASEETPILPTRRCKTILQAAEQIAFNAGSDNIDEKAIAHAVLNEYDGSTNEILANLGIHSTRLAAMILTSNAQAYLATDSSLELKQEIAEHNHFAIVTARTGGLIRGLPGEFPIFIPLLSEQEMREVNIAETFQELFQARALALDSRFGLILSPTISPFLRHVLTQPDAIGVKENIAYLDEKDIRTIITSRAFETRSTFLHTVGKQIRFTTVSPFSTRGTTPGVAFVGRDQEMSTIVQMIASKSYVILGPRRIGKTSLVMQVMLQLRKRGYREFYLDCQSVETYQDFFDNIRLRWKKDIEHDSFTKNLPVTFQEIVAHLFQSDPSKAPLVFVFDEIDRLLKFDMRRDNSELLMRTFRALSQQKVCQFIFSGERRIFQQLHNSDSPHFNFLNPIKLGLLTKKEAQKLIEEPFAQFGIRIEGEPLLTHIITDACSYHPNLLQEMGHRIFEILDKQPDNPDPKVTKSIVAHVIHQPDFAKLYQEIFWGQSNALEKAVTLLAPSNGPIKPIELVYRLHQQGFPCSQERLATALDYLILYCIFQYDDRGITWTASHFKQFLSKTIFDQREYLADLREEFSKGEPDSGDL